jgi:hypothetical protein
MQAQATAGGRVRLDDDQVRAGLTGDIKAVIDQVSSSVLHEVDSMMLASGIQRSLDQTREAVSPIFRGSGFDDEEGAEEGEEGAQDREYEGEEE